MNGSSKLRNEIILSFLIKTAGLGLSYFLIGVTIRFLGAERYGIWVTVQSIMSWFSFFDMGLANGMRNKLAMALTRNEKSKVKEYVSSTFFSLSMISGAIAAVVLVVSLLFDWQAVMNTELPETELLFGFMVTGLLFAANFAISFLNQTFYAYQRPSLSSLVIFLSNLFAVVFVLVISIGLEENLVLIAASYSSSQILSRLLIGYFFFKRHDEAAPEIGYFSLSRAREILKLGSKFFIIQIAAIVIFTTDNMIITQLLGPSEVTPYNISHKLMNLVTFVASTVMAALWSAFTSAYERRDKTWIIKILRTLMKSMFFVFAAVFVLYKLHPRIISLWLGESVSVPSNLVLVMGIYVIVQTWSSIFAHFVNGVGALNVQLITSVIAALINIPLSILFTSSFNMGVIGVALGSIFSLSLFAVAGPLQTFLIIKNLKS